MVFLEYPKCGLGREQVCCDDHACELVSSEHRRALVHPGPAARFADMAVS